MATLETNIRQTNADFQAIKNKIEEAGVNVGNAPTSGYADKVSDVYEAGVKSEYDRFWDAYQNNGDRKGYNYAFAGTGWTDEVFKPKYPLNCTGQTNGLFQTNTKITSVNVPLYFDYKGCQSAFNWCSNLKAISSITVTDIVTFDSWFVECKLLETINFTEDSVIANSISLSPCKKLLKESITSIINVLSIDVTGKTLTLSKTAVDNAFMELDLAEDGTINNYMPGSQSAEWEALANTKTNWTINLV